MPAQTIRAVLFDLDGTLADTADDLALALNRLRLEHQLAPLPLARTRPYTSSGARGLLKIGFDLDPDDVRYASMKERFLDLYGESLCVHTRLFEGMADLLGELEHKAVAWGIVTNKSKRFTEPLVRQLDLLFTDRAPAAVVADAAAAPACAAARGQGNQLAVGKGCLGRSHALSGGDAGETYRSKCGDYRDEGFVEKLTRVHENSLAVGI